MVEFDLSLATVNQTPLDIQGNARRISDTLEEIRDTTGWDAQIPHVVCFPELALTGYGCEDAFFMPHLADSAAGALSRLARQASDILPGALVSVGLPVRHESLLYNCQAVLHGGRVVAIIPKSHLAGEGLHYEPRWFRPWKSGSVSLRHHIPALDQVPMGQIPLDYRGIRIAMEICEDAWVTDRPAVLHYDRAVDLILNPAASHAGFGKYGVRRSIVESSSRQYHCVFGTVNLLGNEAGRSIYDGARIVAADGRILHESDRFSFLDGSASTCRIPLAALRNHRDRLFSRKEEIGPSVHEAANGTDPATRSPMLRIAEGRNTKAGFDLPGERQRRTRSTLVKASRVQVPGGYPGGLPAASEADAEEAPFREFVDLEALALFDYMRKSHSRGYTVSLSGGADSAACAVLVQRMALAGIRELGVNAFLHRAGLDEDTIKQVESPADGTAEPAERRITSLLLHTIYQGTRQNSPVTRDAARTVASALGADHHEIEIDGLVDESRHIIERALNRRLDWQTDDLTLQNIQARARSPIVWMLANATGSLLIATGNRSEASTGYCTMDGDTSGGLAPIAGIDKAFLLRWLRFMEQTGDAFGAVPDLACINRQQPTAELRPLEDGQTDERDLMPYSLLDRIERLALEDLLSPDEITALLLADRAADGTDTYHATLKQLDEQALAGCVDRFFVLWNRSQWKRERFAVSFHIDSYNLDPRSWLRFPVLSRVLQRNDGGES